MTIGEQERILVIKLGALGDIVQAFGPMAAIRRHHQSAHITVLTTKPYAAFLENSDYVDAVWIDERASSIKIDTWWTFRSRLRAGNFVRVYDLQTSDRSSMYRRLFWPGPYPEWSGIAKGCSHPHANPKRDFMHTIERQAEQLHAAGIDHVPEPDLSWVRENVKRFGLPDRYALLVPGGAPHRPAKRWAAENYAALASELAEQGLTPVVIGTAKETDILDRVASATPHAVNLVDQTSFADLAVLARDAHVAIGNDTGPMHLIAATGCPSLALYSHASDPELCAQRGDRVTIIRKPDLGSVIVREVLDAIRAITLT